MSTDSEEEVSLRDAIAYYKQGLTSGKLSPQQTLGFWSNLGNALSELAEEECDPALAEEAIEAGCEALKRVGPTDEAWPGLCSDLSASYLTRFELTGDKSDLKEAITTIRAAVKATEIGDSRRCSRLANLCNTLCSAFEAYGARSYIDEAVTVGRQAVDDKHSNGNDRARAMGNFGRALGLRYDTFQVYSDILTAVEIDKGAISVAEDSSIMTTCKSNMVGHLITVAERDCTDETVERALELGRSIYDELEGTNQAGCAHNLSYLYRLRFERVSEVGNTQAGDAKDLQSAVTFALEAINSYPGEDVLKSMYEDELAVCLELAYEVSPTDADKLPIAIQFAESAVSRTDRNDPQRAVYTNHLVDLLRKRQEPNDLQRAASLSETVLHSENAELVPRITAGQAAGMVCHQLGDISKAFELLQRTVGLIPEAASNALQRSDQQYVLGQCMGLSSTAASIALDDGQQATIAFQVLEKGRAILTELAIRSRSGLAPEIEACAGVQHLLERHKEIKLALGRSLQHPASQPHLNEDVLVTLRSQLQIELSALEAQIHDIAQHELHSIAETCDAAEILGSDFVIAFNVTMSRSDAFIMTQAGVESISLPKLKVQELARRVRNLLGVDRVTRIQLDTWRRNNETLTGLLLWLWECAVEPVLSHLKLLHPLSNGSALPRVCWLTSGALGLMPLHAAGDHSDDSTSFTMAHVVSSYAVSTQALSWCRAELASRTASMDLTEAKAIIVAMPETPEQANLDCAEEVACFLWAFSNFENIAKPTARSTCEALRTAAIVHFACHAESDPEDPSNSSLILLDEGGKTADRLSIYTIAETDSPRALLAVLSACQTADQQKLDHLDETIHLAGAFQIAGFPQVVGSLWEAESDYASDLAVTFYAKFVERGGYSAGRDVGALAMHDAMVQLRSNDPEAVLSWAPFVIYGA